jgi:hypothetical protein
LKKVTGFFSFQGKIRMHVHIHCGNGEAKFWLEPEIQLEKNYRLSASELSQIELIIRKHHNELRSAWKQHFKC